MNKVARRTHMVLSHDSSIVARKRLAVYGSPGKAVGPVCMFPCVCSMSLCPNSNYWAK